MRHACPVCKSKHRTEGAVAMHYAAKHGGSVKVMALKRPRAGVLTVVAVSVITTLATMVGGGTALVVATYHLPEAAPVKAAVLKTVAKF